ncbi:MAG: DUF2141 domain-containing protein [Pseudomonadota bacterium]|nr:DUF2141 domain-containing protein [Pseudomonadota bacterium]
MKARFSAGAAVLMLGLGFGAQAEQPRARAGNLPKIDHLSCTGASNEIRIVVSNVRESVGLITVELYADDQENFLRNEGRVGRFQFAARAPQTKFCIHAPQATTYAIGLYHDENANNHIDKGAFGIPTEPYGVSNNPRMRFSAPTVEESRFSVASGGTYLEIKLKN